jgi:hypothetical protein
MNHNLFYFLLVLISAIKYNHVNAQSESGWLVISQLEVRKTPQSGTWRAGAYLIDNTTNSQSPLGLWHGGESEFHGIKAMLPVNFMATIRSKEVMVFLGLDDDAEDAGNDNTAEDKLFIRFIPLETGMKTTRTFSYVKGKWHVLIHYQFMQYKK